MEDGRAGGRGAKESKSGEIKRDQAEQEARRWRLPLPADATGLKSTTLSSSLPGK